MHARNMGRLSSNMSPHRVVIFLVHVLLLTGCHGFRWTSGPADGSTLYACGDENLLFPWDYATSAGDNVTSIKWYFLGHSQELIALSSNGNFAPMAAFAQRTQLVGKAGLLLSHVVPGDKGNYSVEVSGHDASNAFFSDRRTVVVQVVDQGQLMTSDGQLHATWDTDPVYNDTSGAWSLVLSCGHFTYLSDLPVVLEWLTPSGQVLPSTRYADGRYELHVTQGGDYTCRIPAESIDDVCLSQSPPQATVHLDRMEARMTLVEARQNQLQAENDQLKAQDASLNQSLQTAVAQLQQQESSLSQSVTSLSGKLHSLTDSVAFHAYGGPDASGTVVFTSVVTNEGSGYSSSTGIFTAPRAGLYFFAFTSAPDPGQYPDATVQKDGTAICHTNSNLHNDVASCHTVVHLNTGNKIWVDNSGHISGDSNAFTGFLITADV